MEENMKEILSGTLKPRMIDLFWRTAEGGRDFVMDGVNVYNENAQFVGGKVINMCSYVALEFLKDTPDFPRALEVLGRVIAAVSDLPMETWGILNGITGLYRLKKAGLLETAVDPDTLSRLKQALDWRTFVDERRDYALIHKPTNYYGVAFGIAGYRELMGWEDPSGERRSRVLLQRLLRHIEQYSGEYGFMDETAGEGRFDRYSILIPSEIASLIMNFGQDVPQKIRTMLSASAEIFLHLANEEGRGFPYGRSIGAYGESAALEVLSAAAEAGGILKGQTEELAYAYSCRVMRTMMDFWYDEEMKSVNMWEKGRRTDGYRNKNRILGENMSLFMQMVNTYEHWKKAGWGERTETRPFPELTGQLKNRFFVRFASGKYDRALAVVRDNGFVWAVPFISGGKGYYRTDPYYPVPRSVRVLDAAPDECRGGFLPVLRLQNGRELAPLSFFREITPREESGAWVIECRQDQLCYLDGLAPEPADGIRVRTVYRFENGTIERRDRFSAAKDAPKIAGIRLVQIVYSEDAKAYPDHVEFQNGVIRKISAEGYGRPRVTPVAAEDESAHTPYGRMRTEILWEKKEIPETGQIPEVSWKLEYAAAGSAGSANYFILPDNT